MAISAAFGPPVAMPEPTLTEIAPARVAPAPAAEPPRRSRRGPLIVAVVVLLGAVAGMAVAVLSTRGDGDPAPRRAAAGGAPAVTPGAPTQAPTAVATQTIDGRGFTAEVPDDWSVGGARRENGGRQIQHLLLGPGGATILLVQTPDDPAAPPEEYIARRSALSTNAPESEVLTLDGFPTPECEHRTCSDLVLNGASYGGLAILVNGVPGSDRFAVAEALAQSVTAG